MATESFRVPTHDPDITLYVRNKRLAGMSAFPAEKILLYVHGATYPASTSFDLPLNGLSMMDYLGRQGYDVYLVDLPGYGFSDRPAQMRQSAADNPPFMRTPDAARAVGQAVDAILKRRNVDKLNLMGWSWGTSTMGLYTTQNNDKVNRLVLYAPQWLAKAPPNLGNTGVLGAYRTVSQDSARDRWLKGVPDAKKADLIPPGWFEQWAEATWLTDAEGAAQTPPVLRAPNGIIADSQDYWQAGKPLYDPGRIRVPTLVIHAEWDADLPSYQAQEYFTKLTATPYKRFIELGEGTHTVIMEKNRMQFFREVVAFLNERDPLALD
ncbi:alpha/beta hydrolase [Methylobacterium sp. Leaf113]|nr:alpha/beta hydrolase [Methylobacterium sp. Leaf113]